MSGRDQKKKVHLSCRDKLISSCYEIKLSFSDESNGLLTVLLTE